MSGRQRQVKDEYKAIMIKPIIRDVFFSGQKSEATTKQDLSGKSTSSPILDGQRRSSSMNAITLRG